MKVVGVIIATDDKLGWLVYEPLKNRWWKFDESIYTNISHPDSDFVMEGHEVSIHVLPSEELVMEELVDYLQVFHGLAPEKSRLADV